MKCMVCRPYIALSHLCEFIEDCEFNKLAVRILHLLGTEGPKTTKASKYIRYIYNRVILENATVRAAAVSALAQFAVQLPELRERVKVLLTRYIIHGMSPLWRLNLIFGTIGVWTTMRMKSGIGLSCTCALLITTNSASGTSLMVRRQSCSHHTLE